MAHLQYNKKIMVFGYFGFTNFGDEWLLSTLSSLLRIASTQKVKIFVLYNTKKEIVVEDNLVYIPRWNVYSVVKTIFCVDSIISCGGLFQDETSILSFIYYFTIVVISKLLNKKVVVLNTEFVIKKVPKSVAKLIVGMASYTLIRNYEDVEILQKIKKNKKDTILFCPDICLVDSLKTLPYQQRKDIKVVGLVIKYNVDKRLYKEMCECLKEKYKLVFIPLHISYDYGICLELASFVKSCEIRVWDQVKNYQFLFNDIDLIITSRLHGIVVSMVLGIPFICISEEEKIRKFVKSIFSVYPLSLAEWQNSNFEIKDKYIFYTNKESLQTFASIILEKFKILAANKLI